MDELAGKGRGFYERFIRLPLPATERGLRRCRMCWRAEIQVPRSCSRCGSETVGLNVPEVLSGNDERCQQILKKADSLHARRAYVGLGIMALTGVACLAMLAWSAWLLIFLPIPLSLGVAAVVGYLIWSRRDFASTQTLGQAGSAIASMESTLDELMPAFLGKNKVPKFGRPAILLEERETLALLLTRKGVDVLPERMAVFLDASCLRRDWMHFSERISTMKQHGLDAYEAYLNYLREADPSLDLIPFLQQLLINQGKPCDPETIQAELERARTEMKVRGLEREIDAVRQGEAGIVTLQKVDAMDPFLFQDLIGMIFETRGYLVRPVRKRQDQGADVIVERGQERLVIQTKLYSGNVGNEAVQEVVGARGHYTCTRASVITNQFFTPFAEELAGTTGVELVDRKKLEIMLDEFTKSKKDCVRLAALFEPRSNAMPVEPKAADSEQES